MDDAGLYRHINLALERGLPVIGQHHEHDGVAVLVGSGPSVADQLDSIRAQRAMGRPIVALKDAHDYLIKNGIVPDYAVAIDPQEHRWNCFTLKHPDVRYFIASQCHPAMFDHLEGHQVFLWHLYVAKNQSVPPHGTALIAGGTTTGLRTISLFYSMGYRSIELYGFDSCLKDGLLRMNGDKPNADDDQINEIVVDGKLFFCNPSMTAQANEFQNVYKVMPDIQIVSHGEGLISAIIEARNKQPKARISFIHSGGPGMASYRYRAETPARELGASINDLSADVLVFAKPMPADVAAVKAAKERGAIVIVDFCDDHFDWPYYDEMLRLADAVTCPTGEMAKRIAALGREALVVEDPFEYPEAAPHCNGNNVLWFGHAVNYMSLERIRPQLSSYPLRVVSNVAGTIPWSVDGMLEEFARADIVILPETASYKSANRAVEAIRQGCFVVAEPHPALREIPGIWLGNIKDGIEWAIQNPKAANQRTLEAQGYVTERFSPRTQACAMSRIIQESGLTSDPATANGTDG